MDGLLIDSEDKYTICTNAILTKYGRPELPWHIKAQLQGRPGPAAGKIFNEWAKLPVSREQYLEEVKELQQKHFPETKALPGVRDLLTTLKKRTDVKMALATSSMAMNFDLKTSHLEDEIFYVLEPEHRVLGDDSRIGKDRGKPAPDIYLVALETINVRIRREGGKAIEPQECLVFEDSVPGVESGRRAGMQVVWCPHPGLLNEYRGREAQVLAGLTGEYKGEVEEKNETIGVVDAHGEVRRKGAPGELDDGWARLYNTLEDFPYTDYGIHVKEENRL